MPNLKEVRNRITSVNSTKQITSAMKMVAAAKLKRAQDAITQMRPYAEKLSEILGNVSASLDVSENAYAEEREVKKVLIVGVTSNRGLCGSFNAQINKKIDKFIKSELSDVHVDVVAVGKKAQDFFRKQQLLLEEGGSVPQESNDIFDNIEFGVVSELAEKIMDAFLNGEYDKVYIGYNQFKNAATQVSTIEQFLPVVTPETDDSSSEYIFEPNKKDILDEMIPKSLKTQLFKAILDSNASEHGARMTAMHQATENATDLLKELKLTYNKARQAAITKEILEITSGAEALAAD
ncbi:ATP synthase F1 subunit gamma [Salibacter sp.]|uniref:ATP synthase F1 subunit gamma n=1 Tax=Salibacter sp. TaxID=2010995 RepID=UPI00286FB618|nr:ATP synthase F1 subunit gamma [Salibacter sp.]MDR9398799.1 ATP synthase F1 subunit gamma [Salibacter sp.]MDR9487861.1 ATP synthase F1 subunit gamma [Salibacter sp.]